MSELKTLDVYLYDIFEKDYAKKTIIPHLNDALGQCTEPNTGINNLDFSGFSGYKEKRFKWMVSDLSNSFNVIQEVCNERKLRKDLSKTRECITKIELWGIDNPNVPYFVLMMSIEIDKTKINSDDTHKEIPRIIDPVRIYMDNFKGITTKTFSRSPLCPYFVHVSLYMSKTEINKITKTIKKLDKSKDFCNNPKKLESYKTISSELRKIIPYNQGYLRTDLLSILYSSSDSVLFSGYGVMPMIDEFAPYVLELTSNLTHIAPSAFDLSQQGPSLIVEATLGFYLPTENLTRLLYLTTLIIWNEYAEKSIKKLHEEFTNLRKEITKLTTSSDNTHLQNYLSKLNELGSKLDQHILDASQMKRTVDRHLDKFMSWDSTFEIPVLSDEKQYWWTHEDIILENSVKGAYVKSMAYKIRKVMERLNDALFQYSPENDMLAKRVDDMTNLANQNTMKHYGKITIFATIAIISLTIVMLIKTFSNS